MTTAEIDVAQMPALATVRATGATYLWATQRRGPQRMSPLYRHFGREMTWTWGANNGLGGRLINGAVSRDTAGDILVRWQQHLRTIGARRL